MKGIAGMNCFSNLKIAGTLLLKGDLSGVTIAGLLRFDAMQIKIIQNTQPEKVFRHSH